MLENLIKTFYEWEKWEGILHNILFMLNIYIIFLFIIDKNNRTITNLLLFTIIIAIDTLIHQNINIRNQKEENT